MQLPTGDLQRTAEQEERGGRDIFTVLFGYLAGKFKEYHEKPRAG